MGKTIYMYRNTKKQLLECYNRLFTVKKLHQHFFFNRDYGKETKKQLLKEINKNYKYEFLRDDLIDYTYQGNTKKKIFKNENDLKRELKTVSKNNKVTKENRGKILQVFRGYVHPLDYRGMRKDSLQKLQDYVTYGF